MKISRHYFLLHAILLVMFTGSAAAQTWVFSKEKDGIKVYTRKEAGKSLKAYRGVVEIKAPSDKVFAMLENVNNTDWWDENLTQIKVLLYEKYKRAQYYLVYDLPWPITDRDLCVDVRAAYDPVTGEGAIVAVPLPGLVPEKEGMIRIREYRQTWSVKPAGKTNSYVVLEGFVDPAGSIPDWLLNMLIVDSPIKVIGAAKERLERN